MNLVNIYTESYQNLVRTVNLEDINASYTFINLAAKLRDNHGGDNYIDRILNPILNMRVPVNPYLTIRYIDFNSVTVKDSSTAPVIIPCIVESDYDSPPDIISSSPIHNTFPMSSSPFTSSIPSGYWYSVMYKKTDVRYDQTVMSLIRLSDQILKENGMDLDITIYRVLPTGYHSGLIEVIPNSETINSLVSTQSIQNYIMEFNPGEKVGTIKQRFINSMASYCVIMYLLGIGDRHLDNIMVTRNGRLFHIDFTYLLGNDPKPLAPKMRITEEMVDVLGGVDSRYYQRFIDICTKCYECLRRYDYLFYCLLTPLTELGLTNLEEEIKRRFLPGEQKADVQLVKTINDSTTSYRYNLTDILHQQGKLIHKLWSMLKHR
jgi:phosphatidylinositol 3-kinase